MKLSQAAVAAVAAVVTGVGGGVAAAQVNRDTAGAGDRPPADASASASRSGSPTTTSTSSSRAPTASSASTAGAPSPRARATTSPTTAAPATPTATRTAAPVDRLSEENLIRERLYYDVTGHSFSTTSGVDGAREPLGPCTGDTTFSDVLPKRGFRQLGTILAGSDVTRVTELLAQTRSPKRARSAAEDIVTMVERCPGVQGGDFGYGDPVTVHSDTHRQAVYFPGYDSDRRYGGYIVFSVGTRVGVVSVADHVDAQQVGHLAKEASKIAGI